MALLTAKTYSPRPIRAYESVWNSKEKRFIAVTSMDKIHVHMVLDGISLAIEAGVIDSHGWPQQLFSSRAAFDEFIEQLSGYDDCYRITDQWWQALATIADFVDEEGFISSSDIAEELYSAASEHGLLQNWNKKVPDFKYSEREVEEALFVTLKYQYSGYLNTYCWPMDRDKLNEVLSFGSRHYAHILSPERMKQALAEGEAVAADAKVTKSTKKAEKKTRNS
jgi:hypothetical protein